MPDTQPPAPTDAEIWQLWVPMARKGVADPVDFARAVLAKWGSLPVAREPLTDEHLRVIERMHVFAHTATLMDFARAVEAAHGICIKGGRHDL